MFDQPPFKISHPLRCLQAPFGSANFLTENEVINFQLTAQGFGKKLCPYVGFINTNYAFFARKPYFASTFQKIDHTPSMFSELPLHTDGNGHLLTSELPPINMFSELPLHTDGNGHLLTSELPPINMFSELPLHTDGNGHLLTVAPTRAGKGTGHIITNLLTWAGSVLVIDIKGENYLRSAGYRKEKLAQKVIRFAPFEKVSEVWNPILSIRADPNSEDSTPEEEEDARYLTNLLITPSGSGDAEFWENSAKNFLEGLLLYVRTASLQLDKKDEDNSENEYVLRERSMREVRRLLSLDKEDFESLLSDMGNSKRTLIRQAGNNLSRLMSGNSKTGQSILAIALEQTAVWAYQRLHKVAYKASEDDNDREPAPNDFSFSQLRDGNTSIYLIIPPDYLTEYRAVLRVMIGFAMRELRQSFVQYKKSLEHQDKPPILFILDEFPQLAYMRPIEEALLYLAGYDVRFWFFVQDISQLQLHYKDSWQTFFANTGTQCFFGVSDIATANLVSEMAGMTTTQHTSHTFELAYIDMNEELYYFSKYDLSYHRLWSYSLDNNKDFLNSSQDGMLYFRSKNYPWHYHPVPNTCKSSTVANTSRQLITPDEVMRLQDDEQIVFIKGIKPIHCYRLSYYEIHGFNERSNINPPHEVDFF